MPSAVPVVSGTPGPSLTTASASRASGSSILVSGSRSGPVRKLSSQASITLKSFQNVVHVSSSEPPRTDVLTRRAFLIFLQQDLREQRGIFMLPFSFLMLALFIGIVMGHERSFSRLSLRSAIKDDIVENCGYDILNGSTSFKDIDNVNVPSAVIEWLRLGYFDHMLWKGAGDDGTLAGTYLQYNKIIGGVRFLTQRYEESVGYCNFEVADMLQSPCMHLSEDDWEAEGYDDLAFPPDGQETAKWSAGPSFDRSAIQPNRVRWFMMSEKKDNHSEKLQELLDTSFIDRQTRHVMLSMLMYNADLHFITLVEANFFFSRTGRVWPLLRIKTVDPDPFLEVQLALVDAVFITLLGGNVLKDVRTICIYWRKVGFSNLNRNLPHGIIWYVLDVVAILFGFMLSFTFWRYWTVIDKVGKELEANYPHLATDEAQLSTFFDSMEEATHSTVLPYRYVLLIYPFSLMMRLGLGFSGNPRLAMFMHVFSAAKQSFYHYSIVFTSFTLTFAILSMLLFGREMEAYSTFSRALQTNIQMLFGDVDWEALSVLGFLKGMIFYWAFHASLVLIVFNILVAIIVDTYETIREEIGRRVMPQTLWQQAVAMVERRRRERSLGHVPLHRVWMRCLDYYGHEFHSDEEFGLADLKAVVPDIPDDQANDLIADAEIDLLKYVHCEEEPYVRLPQDLRRLRTVWKRLELLLLVGDRPDASPPSSSSRRRRRPGDDGQAAMASVLRKKGDSSDSRSPDVVALPANFEELDLHDGTQLRLDGAAAVLRLALKLAERRSGGADGPPSAEQNRGENVARAIRLSLALVDWYPSASSSGIPGMLPGGQRLPSEASANFSNRCGIMCCTVSRD